MFEESKTYKIFIIVFFIGLMFLTLCGCSTTPKPRPKEYKCVTIDHGTWAQFKCKPSVRS